MANLPVPVPATEAPGNFITSALWNAQVRDAVNFLANPPIFFGYQSAAQSLPANAYAAILIDTEITDTYGGHSTTTNTSRYVCQLAGVYEVSASAATSSNSGGLLSYYIGKNGAEVTGTRAAAFPMTNHFTGSALAPIQISLAVGDYVELYVLSTVVANSGGGPWSNLSVKFIHA